MAKVFLLTGNRQGKTEVINKRYAFTNGAMVVNSDEDANLMAQILVPFYACKMVPLEMYEEALQRKQTQEALAKKTEE